MFFTANLPSVCSKILICKHKTQAIYNIADVWYNPNTRNNNPLLIKTNLFLFHKSKGKTANNIDNDM